MILVLGYNNTESGFLNKIFSELNIEYRYSLLEGQISKADKLILPHPQNFNSTYRRMQMMNLFSLLRLIKKPILGINDGFCLMCNHILNKYKCGLGLFDMDIESNTDEDVNEQNFIEGYLNKMGESVLVKNLKEKEVIHFLPKREIENYPYITSMIKNKEENYALTLEHKNYFSVKLNFEHNRQIGEQIIRNFLLH